MNNEKVLDVLEQFVQRTDRDVSKRHQMHNLLHRLQLGYWYLIDHHLIEHISWHKWILQFPFVTKPILDRYETYIRHLPRCGGLLLNKSRTKVLLVQAAKSKQWGFPCGRPYIHETSQQTAIREVKEETGYDGPCSKLFLHYGQWACTCSECNNSNGEMSKSIKKISQSIFLFLDVPEDFPFEPQTRGEIKAFRWVPIGELSKYTLTRGWVPKITGLLHHLQNSQNVSSSSS